MPTRIIEYPKNLKLNTVILIAKNHGVFIKTRGRFYCLARNTEESAFCIPSLLHFSYAFIIPQFLLFVNEFVTNDIYTSQTT